MNSVLVYSGFFAWGFELDHQTFTIAEIDHVWHTALAGGGPFEGQPASLSGVAIYDMLDARLSHMLITHYSVVFVPTKQPKQVLLSEALLRCPEA